MALATALVVFCLLYSRDVFAAQILTVNVDKNSGSYSVDVNGKTWFHNGDTGFYADKKWYSVNDQSLALKSSREYPRKSCCLKWWNLQCQGYSGDDKVGKFAAVELNYQTGSITMYATVKTYTESETVVFEQHFPDGLNSTSVGDNSEVITGFPSFSDMDTAFHYMTFTDTFANVHLGYWKNNPAFPGGAAGGTPVAFYDDHFNTLVVSPLSNYMVASQTLSAHFGKILVCGIQGKVTSLPVGFRHSTIVSYSVGVSQAFMDWGDRLLSITGKPRDIFKTDDTNMRLAYWTDNGAYYYYITEPNKNYGQTMIDVYNYEKDLIPVQYYQFDSWWYYKGQGDGVKLWEPRDDIFPDGMLKLDQNMGNLPLILHNRYFSPDNDYIGMGYPFAVEEKCALPLNEDLFTYIMKKCKDWGMTVYEQDWLVTTYMDMTSTQNTTEAAHKWLLDMGSAATKLNLTIQYCMPLPRHILTSTEIPSVTQCRVTGDYQPGNSQWKVAHTSLLLWAVGLIPFKDNFWTTSDQSGCKYKSCTEPNPVLETLVASLTNGPVGPADKIDKTNKDLVMKTCMQDGTLLKSDRPAFPVDKALLVDQDHIIQLWETQTTISGNTWKYVLGAELVDSISLAPADLGLDSAYKGMYFESANASAVSSFSVSSPLVVPKMKSGDAPVDYRYYVVAPVLSNGWTFLGELQKFLSVSKTRVLDLAITSTELEVHLVGSPNEAVSVGFLAPSSSKVIEVDCTIGDGGRVAVRCGANDACTC